MADVTIVPGPRRLEHHGVSTNPTPARIARSVASTNAPVFCCVPLDRRAHPPMGQPANSLALAAGNSSSERMPCSFSVPSCIS